MLILTSDNLFPSCRVNIPPAGLDLVPLNQTRRSAVCFSCLWGYEFLNPSRSAYVWSPILDNTTHQAYRLGGRIDFV